MERRNLNDYRTTKIEVHGQDVGQLFGSSSENGSTFSDPFEDDTINWAVFEDENLLRFLANPINVHELQAEEYNSFPSPQFMENYGAPAPIANLSNSELGWEPPSAQSQLITSTLFDKAVALGMPFAQQTDFHISLKSLITPSKIEKLVSLYFEFWHPHCPIVHQPSFSINNVHIALLIPVILMGAMYSPIDQENSTAKLVMDVAELYIYSLDDLREEFEISSYILRAMSGSSMAQSASPSPYTFQVLQGAYLMVCIQFWAGNAIARKRSIESRFAAVIKVGPSYLCIDSSDRIPQLARRIDLPKATHTQSDGASEGAWIQKECRIR